MAVFKSGVAVCDAAGQQLGVGIGYVHLRLPAEADQRAPGTVSLRRWQPAGALPAHLLLDDGRRLAISVTAERLSDCSRNHILRFEAAWPPSAPAPSP